MAAIARLVALQREGVLVRAADAVADRDALGVGAHVAVLDGAPQAVVDGRVDERRRRRGGSRTGRPGSRNGAWFMISMPPATTISASPARISAAASMIALSPEPQTRLIVVALVVTGQAGLERRLAGRRLADAGLEDLAHQDLVDRRVARASPARSTAARIATPPSSVAGTLGQRAAELADRRARGADEVDVAVRALVLHRRECTPASGESGVSAGRQTGGMDDTRVGQRLRAVRIHEALASAGSGAGSRGRRADGHVPDRARSARGAHARGHPAVAACARRAHRTRRPLASGGDLDRMVNARHAALHEAVARVFAASAHWSDRARGLIQRVSANAGPSTCSRGTSRAERSWSSSSRPRSSTSRDSSVLSTGTVAWLHASRASAGGSRRRYRRGSPSRPGGRTSGLSPPIAPCFTARSQPMDDGWPPGSGTRSGVWTP